jgi:hypothetical protein
MPMYYFHLRDSETVPDVDGTNLADVSAARSHAASVARELMFRRRGMLQRAWREWTMLVHDSAGNELFSFKMADFETDGSGT